MSNRTQREFDAIIIGGGHNGLVTAAYLGKAGFKVLVAERREILGGAAATESIFDGCLTDIGASNAGLFLPEIVDDLQLYDHGLQFLESPALITSLLPDGDSFTLWRDPLRTQQEIARFSEVDAGRYLEFLDWLKAARKILKPVLTLRPPALPDVNTSELLSWLSFGLRARLQKNHLLIDLLRVLPMPMEDFLNEWFESPILKGALAGTCLRGASVGPKSPGTTFLLLYQTLNARKDEVFACRFIKGGVGELSNALARCASQSGVEICTGMNVSRVILREGRAAGVLLESGVEIFAPCVVSNADSRSTFFDLVGTEALEVRFVREIRNIRFAGSVARIILLLEGPPRLTALERTSWENTSLPAAVRFLICPDMDTLERAADAAKFGQIPLQPVLDLTIPTMMDSGLVPPGKHLVAVDLYFVPNHLETADWATARQELESRVIKLLETHAPGISERIIDSRLFTPSDYAKTIGLPDGDPYHGQMGLDQLLFMRPVPQASRYETPIQGFYLCGAGSHPGGGLTGAPGYNAAQKIIQDYIK